MIFGFQAIFPLLCAIYTTTCKRARAVLSVVRRCSRSLILYLYVYDEHMVVHVLLEMISVCELVNVGLYLLREVKGAL